MGHLWFRNRAAAERLRPSQYELRVLGGLSANRNFSFGRTETVGYFGEHGDQSAVSDTTENGASEPRGGRSGARSERAPIGIDRNGQNHKMPIEKVSELLKKRSPPVDWRAFTIGKVFL